MTAQTVFRIGSYVGWQRRIYRITALAPGTPQHLMLEDVQSLEVRDTPLYEMLFAPDERDAPVFGPTEEAIRSQIKQQHPAPPLTNASGLPNNLLKRADRIIATVVTVEREVTQKRLDATAHGGIFQRVTALTQALSTLPLHATLATEAQHVQLQTYYRYLATYTKESGGRAAIAASLRRTTLHRSQMSKGVLHFFDMLILRYYARQRPMRPHTLYETAADVLTRTQGLWIDPTTCAAGMPEDLVQELLNPKIPMEVILANPDKMKHLTPIKLPSQSWFYGYLRYYENRTDMGEAIITERYGHDVWEREHLVFDTFVRQAAMPLQYTFGDHWLLDTFIVDEATRRRVDRLWLTLIIDAYSRCILGMALLYEAPSIMSLQTALLHAIWPKRDQPTWSCYGIPMQIFLDNAWAHHSHSVEDLARQVSQGGRYMSIDLIFRPPYKGRYGAIIERLFGTLSGKVKEHLPGAIHSSSRKAVGNAMNRACLLYGDLEQFLLQEIVAYQHHPHAELQGMTPEEKWREGMQLMGLPVVPPLTPAMERLFWREDPDPRQIHEKGISSFGLNYWSDALAKLERREQTGEPIAYMRRFNPQNISTLAVFREGVYQGDVSAQSLRLPDGSYRQVSLSERKLARALVVPGARGTENWVERLDEIDVTTKQREQEKRRVQKTQRATPPKLSTVQLMDQARALALSTEDQLYTGLLSKAPKGDTGQWH